MIIRKMDIKGFGNLQNKVFIPGPGMNLVYGPNESGKSTLMAFIRGMLYGVKGGRKSREGQLPPLKQYMPWHHASYAGIMEYLCDNGDSFRVGRNFEKGSLNIHDIHANNITSLFPADRDGARFAEAHLGVDEAAFERTLFVPQLGTALDAASRKVLYDKLVNIKETGNEDISLKKAMDALKRSMMDQVGSERSTTRPLDRLDAQISVLEDEERLERERRNRLLESIVARRETQRQLEAGIKEIEFLREELRKVNAQARISGLKTKLSRLKELKEAAVRQEADLQEAIQEQVRIAGELDKLKAFSEMDSKYIQDLPVDYGRLCSMRDTIQELKEKLALEQQELGKFDTELRAEQEIFAEESDPERLVDEWYAARDAVGGTFERTQVIDAVLGRNNPTRKLLPLVIALSVLSMALLVVGVLLRLPAAWITGGMLTCLGIVSTVVILRKTQNKSETAVPSGAEQHWHMIRIRMERLLQQADVQNVSDLIRMLQHLAARQGRLRALSNHVTEMRVEQDRLLIEKQSLESKMAEILASAGIRHNGPITAEEMSQFSNLGTSFFDCQSRNAANRVKKENLTGGIETIYREAALLSGLNITIRADLEDILGKLEREVTRVSDDANLQEASKEMNDPERLTLDIQNAEHQLEELRLQLRTHETRLEFLPQEERLQEIAEELTLLRDKRQSLVRFGSSLRLAIDVLEQAGQKVRRDFAPDFNANVSRFMRIMTGNRYENIRADDALALHVEMEGLEELASLPMLSGGTIDQAYLAMRLAAIVYLEESGETLPIFLDEPFSQYDEKRMLQTVELLRELSAKRQIFLFSCKERERDVIRNAFGAENFTELSL